MPRVHPNPALDGAPKTLGHRACGDLVPGTGSPAQGGWVLCLCSSEKLFASSSLLFHVRRVEYCFFYCFCTVQFSEYNLKSKEESQLCFTHWYFLSFAFILKASTKDVMNLTHFKHFIPN